MSKKPSRQTLVSAMKSIAGYFDSIDCDIREGFESGLKGSDMTRIQETAQAGSRRIKSLLKDQTQNMRNEGCHALNQNGKRCNRLIATKIIRQNNRYRLACGTHSQEPENMKWFGRIAEFDDDEYIKGEVVTILENN